MKWYKISIVALACLVFTGCNKRLPDAYQEGSDYQYMERMAFSSFHQKGKDVEYFAYGNYIYYMDKENGELLPLCGKADCLHDKENDSERIQQCNAYMETESVDTGISYCNGYLYYIDKASASEKPALYRLSADGMEKEQIYQWEKDVGIEEWMTHRDVLYYAEHIYLSGKDGTEERYTLKALPLTGKVKKPKVVHEVDKNMEVFTIADLQAYGNFLYFQVHSQKKTEEEITDENYFKYWSIKTFIYDMEKDKVKELTIPDLGKYDVIQGVAFWQGRIIFSPFNPQIDYMEPTTWYIADLDGSDVEGFMEDEDIGQGLMFLSDGKYLYLSNVNMVWRGYDKGEETYKIYDKNLELVDTVKLPFKPSFGDVAVGTPETMYLNYEKTESDKEETDEEKADIGKEEGEEKETEWGVMYWDKSKIGSYHGSAFETTDIKYEG